MGEPRHIAWIRDHALGDGLWERAYARLDPAARSRLKLCIARLHALWGEQPLSRRLSLSLAGGFTAAWEWTLAPYALILCPANLEHPERLLAACLPPLLAGVERVLPWFLAPAPGASPLSPLLAALELAGLEEAVLASEDETLQGLALVRESLGAGRILLLGPRSRSESFVLAAHRLDLPCLALSGDEGDAPFLTLDEAHEGVWVWPDLTPEWFSRRRLALEGARRAADDPA
jgi:hypothetical protein